MYNSFIDELTLNWRTEMNKKWMTLALVLLLSTILFLVVGCSDSNDIAGTTNQNTAELYATWEQTSVTVDGVGQSLADFFEWSTGTVRVNVTLNADSTYYVNEYDASDSTLYLESGTLTISGSQITITDTSENGVAVTPVVNFDGTWAINNNILTLTTTSEGHAIIITMTKIGT